MPTATRAAVDTSGVDLRTAAAIEAAEARAWGDMYAAAPPGFAASAGVSTRNVSGALVLSWAATGRRYFSRTIGLGVMEPASPDAVDEVIAGYAAAGIGTFLISSQPHCRPREFEDWLRARTLEPFDAQDRVVRGPQPVASTRTPAAVERGLAVERVTASTADEWAEFIQRVYRLDTDRWLQALIGRRGWHQYVVREGGEIVAARGMYLTPERVAWMGMDGPVPGLSTQDYEPDAALCQTMVADGLAAGTQMFIADIEAPAPTRDTPAYHYFGRLGFRQPYSRTHWKVP